MFTHYISKIQERAATYFVFVVVLHGLVESKITCLCDDRKVIFKYDRVAYVDLDLFWCPIIVN